MTKFMLALLVATVLSTTLPERSYAIESSSQMTAAEESAAVEEIKPVAENRIMITYPAFVDAPENHMPPSIYEYEGQVYTLADYEVIKSSLEEKIEKASDIVNYKNVEQIDKIPLSCEIQAKNKITGQTVLAEVPLTGCEYSNYRWSNDFEFKITVEEADAEAYALGNILVPAKETAPFAGYERLLLELIHVDPAYYRIDSVEWVTEPWIGNDKRIYREALAKGAKQVADVKAQYSGNVSFPATEAMAVQSNYVLNKIAEEPKPELEPEIENEPEKKPGIWDYLKKILDFILNFIKDHPVLCLSLLLVIIIFAIILIVHKMTKKGEGADENNRNCWQPKQNRNNHSGPTDGFVP